MGRGKVYLFFEGGQPNGGGEEGRFAPVAQLPSLTCLDLGDCGLMECPAELTALGSELQVAVAGGGRAWRRRLMLPVANLPRGVRMSQAVPKPEALRTTASAGLCKHALASLDDDPARHPPMRAPAFGPVTKCSAVQVLVLEGNHFLPQDLSLLSALSASLTSLSLAARGDEGALSLPPLAALRVNVSSRMRPGSAPRAISTATR